MNQKTRSICNRHKNPNCRESCPLSGACKERNGDNAFILADRMNKAAEKVIFKGIK